MLYFNYREAIFFSILIPLIYGLLYPFSSNPIDIIVVFQRMFVIASIGLFTTLLNRNLIEIAIEKELAEQKEKEEHSRRIVETKMNKKLEIINKQLQRSNKDLEQFALIASHDLKVPIAKIILALQNLDREKFKNLDLETKTVIEMISKSTAQMNELISELLIYSQISESKTYNLIDFNNVLETVLENLSVFISEKGAKITSKALPRSQANEPLMISLFQNLIQNGIKFNKSPNPEIFIESEEQGDFIIFKIKDNGIGFIDESKKTLFTLFKRFENNEEYSGTGVGLSFCKKIVDQHNGKIWLESERDKGSTFFIELPKVITQDL